MVVVAWLGGCAAPASREAMSATAAQAGAAAPMAVRAQPYSVRVVTSGGATTGAMDSSNVGNEDLKAAIESSIRDSKAFREVVQEADGQYELAVNIIQLNKPMFGLSFTVDLEAGWTLTRTNDRQLVFRQVIKSTHTAGVSDAFAGVTRLRLAVEGAVRKNIGQGLTAVTQAIPATVGSIEPRPAPAPTPSAVGPTTASPTTAVAAPVMAPERVAPAQRATAAERLAAPAVPEATATPVRTAAAERSSAPDRAPVSAGLSGGTHMHTVERLPETKSCSSSPRATLVAKGPGFESYTVACQNGDAIVVRCEFGNCRVLQ